MTKVKICGLSRPEDIEAVNAYGADYAGFVFFEKSKRNVGYEKAEKLLRQLKKNPNIQSVAVCVSPSKEEVKRLNDMGFDLDSRNNSGRLSVRWRSGVVAGGKYRWKFRCKCRRAVCAGAKHQRLCGRWG